MDLHISELVSVLIFVAFSCGEQTFSSLGMWEVQRDENPEDK